MKDTYVIRQANQQDIPRIAEIIVFGKRVAYRPIFENDEVSFNDLQVVAYVEPFFVGQGIGTHLLEHLIKQARQKGFQKIILWVIKDNMKARKFYEEKGFVDSGKKCIIEGTDKIDCRYEYTCD